MHDYAVNQPNPIPGAFRHGPTILFLCLSSPSHPVTPHHFLLAPLTRALSPPFLFAPFLGVYLPFEYLSCQRSKVESGAGNFPLSRTSSFYIWRGGLSVSICGKVSAEIARRY